MILGSWSRQELTDYPGNGRGGGVMVSQGQIQPLTATFVKFCSCAQCRNTLCSAEIQQKYSGAFVRKHLLSCSVTHSTCRVQLELEPFAERGELLPMKMQLHLFSVLSYLHIFAKPVQIVELLGFYGNDDRR